MTCQRMALNTCYLPDDGLFRNTWPVLLKENVMFNVHGSVRRNNILVYKSQQDAHVTEFIFI